MSRVNRALAPSKLRGRRGVALRAAILLALGVGLCGCGRSEEGGGHRGDEELEADPLAVAAFQRAATAAGRPGPAGMAGVDSLESLYRRYPKSRRVRNSLHNAYLGRQNYEAAVAVFESSDAAERTPEEIEHLAKLYFKVGRFEGAANLLAPLSRRDPADRDLAVTLARALFSHGDYDAAEAVIERGGQALLQSGDPEVARIRGLVRFYRGEADSALAILEPAVERWPQYPPLRYAVARTLSEIGQPGRAQRQLEEFQSLVDAVNEANSRQMWMSGRALELRAALGERRFGEAETIVTELLPVADDSMKIELYQVLAQTYEANGRHAAADSARQEAVRLHGALVESR